MQLGVGNRTKPGEKHSIQKDDVIKMISFVHKGDFKNTERFFESITKRDFISKLREYGEKGVQALAEATPKDTGKTASSWVYEIVEDKNSISIVWSNTNVVKGYANVAILLQYGHGTRNGGYVVGRDYINPAMRPLFDELADKAWKEVVSK